MKLRELDYCTYAISNIEETEVESIIKIINSIQELKEHHVYKSELVIVFAQELKLYGIQIIEHHLNETL